MKPNRHLRVTPFDEEDVLTGQLQSGSSPYQQLSTAVERLIARARTWLLGQQQTDGHWVGELEGDTILESEYILLLAFLDQHASETARKAAQYILRQQLPDGGWAIYPGGGVDISASVKAYFALKLTGHDPSAAPMQRARAAIMGHGGADAVNSFTRFYLALLGQISYKQCPAVPVEILLLPSWAPINLFKVSAWSRTIIVPLSIMSACEPMTELEERLGISELFSRPPDEWPPLRCPGHTGGAGIFSWDRFFRSVDRTLKFFTRRRWLPFRKRALKVAEKWVVDRFAGSEGLGAIFPPMIWSIVALRCLGYRDDSPEVKYCHRHLQGLLIEEDDTIRLQPCKSPVWDTAISLRALAASGLEPRHAAARRAVDWLLSQEVRRRGDWSQTVAAEPGGWSFEYANEFYPDVDDTIMVVMALHSQMGTAQNATGPLPANLQWIDQTTVANPSEARQRISTLDQLAAASERALNWVLALQNRDGGWGAFDRSNDHEFLCHVPFADHNAMIDPSTPDLTGRVLEMLGQLGRRVGDPVVDSAVAYMRHTQEVDGSWFGRWGVNYIYGTWQALAGLAAVGVTFDDSVMVAGADWLLAYQQLCGGWGESPDSYALPHLRGQGPTTASQTAWALLGLIAAGLARHPATARGVRHLLRTQREDGTWAEPEFTGTGFPQVFYLRYHLYPIYFPLLAVSQWTTAARDEENSAAADDAQALAPAVDSN
ncbi:MAG: terpene cyclase/mutase family protein [Planctomycetia bacterium]|nr:terpene cyclase/mutase family protein [Planctomycetia bacterium]